MSNCVDTLGNNSIFKESSLFDTCSFNDENGISMRDVEVPLTSQCIPVGIGEVSHSVPLVIFPISIVLFSIFIGIDSVTMSSSPGKLANIHPAICVLQTSSPMPDPLDVLARVDLAGGADVAADPVHPVTLEPALLDVTILGD